jgi:hypothetical protein
VAYSLGDFCTHLPFDKHRYGIVVKVEIGPGEGGDWRAGRVEWRYLYVNHLDDETTRVDLADTCPYFEPTD